MRFEDLTPERQDQLKACKTSEELMDLADELDIDLPSEYLEAIAGGLAEGNFSMRAACPAFI